MQPLIKAEHVSKKFCRSLKRSLWYGIQDVAHSLNPWSREQQQAELEQKTTAASLRRDEFWALQDINFEVHRGECLGLIGHNGAGKSTLLKILNGLIRPDRGRITMRGRVAALIELNAGFNNLLTGRENIYNQAALLGFSSSETRSKFDQIVDFAGVERFIDTPVQSYSSGMKVRLGFAVAAQMEPDVLIIDEVLAVGDTSFRFKCLNRMAEIMKQSAVVFVSHSMQQITRASTLAMVLSHGSTVYYGKLISEAIRAYYDTQSTVGPSATGSGAVEVRGVRAICGTEEAHNFGAAIKCNAGEEILLVFNLNVHSEITHFILQGLLWNEDLVPAVELLDTPERGLLIDMSQNDANLSVRLRICTDGFNGGNYQMCLSAVSPDYRKILCRFDNLLKISIVNPTVSGACYLLRCGWEIENKAEP
jgi:lipopolysaccharide transport system ATP-binding protein